MLTWIVQDFSCSLANAKSGFEFQLFEQGFSNHAGLMIDVKL
jgi:hypothetical protein